MERTKGPAFIVVGRVVRPHGLDGELRVEPDTDFPERLAALREITLLKDEASMSAAVVSIRPHGTAVLIKLEGIDSIDAASRWRDAAVAIPRRHAAPLEAGRHYVSDVLGLRVETEDGRVIGTVAEVLRTGSNDVYVVSMSGPPRNSHERTSGAAGAGKELLVPAISSVVLMVDVAGGRILIRPMPGMLETG